MQGMMMNQSLSIIEILRYAAEAHPGGEVVSVRTEGDLHRESYAEAYLRAAQLAHGLSGLDIARGDRVATLAWNGHRHFELYYGVSGMGAVLHTINPRLFPEQLVYIVNHAEDTYLFVDLTFVPLLETLAERIARVPPATAQVVKRSINKTLDLMGQRDAKSLTWAIESGVENDRI